jgi:carboxylesterase type B
LVDFYGYDKEKYGDLGVGHADELFLLFTNDLNKGGRTPEDQKVSDMLIRMWVAFAKGGAPDENWARYQGNEPYRIIDGDAEIKEPSSRKDASQEMVNMSVKSINILNNKHFLPLLT